MSVDPYDLERFVDAQASVFDRVIGELRSGRKDGHWMWFIFPQIAGLGRSATAVRFAIHSLSEARAYMAHPILGLRLRECSALVVGVESRPLADILGHIDALKFRSSMTLFAHAAPEERVFQQALDKYFGGSPDPQTLQRLHRPRGGPQPSA